MNWDVNGDGINDFTFSNRYPNTAPGLYGVVWQINMNGLGTNGTLSYMGPFIRYAFALQYGATIDGTGSFNAGGQACLGSRYSYGAAGVFYYGGFAANGPNGSVAPGTFAFAGFKFQAADGVHFGYVRLAVSAGLLNFVPFAVYESTPGMGIQVGIPEPGTLSLLALGAVGAIGAVVKRRRS